MDLKLFSISDESNRTNKEYFEVDINPSTLLVEDVNEVLSLPGKEYYRSLVSWLGDNPQLQEVKDFTYFVAVAGPTETIKVRNFIVECEQIKTEWVM